jgi:hypothetical protein
MTFGRNMDVRNGLRHWMSGIKSRDESSKCRKFIVKGFK